MRNPSIEEQHSLQNNSETPRNSAPPRQHSVESANDSGVDSTLPLENRGFVHFETDFAFQTVESTAVIGRLVDQLGLRHPTDWSMDAQYHIETQHNGTSKIIIHPLPANQKLRQIFAAAQAELAQHGVNCKIEHSNGVLSQMIRYVPDTPAVLSLLQEIIDRLNLPHLNFKNYQQKISDLDLPAENYFKEHTKEGAIFDTNLFAAIKAEASQKKDEVRFKQDLMYTIKRFIVSYAGFIPDQEIAGELREHIVCRSMELYLYIESVLNYCWQELTRRISIAPDRQNDIRDRLMIDIVETLMVNCVANNSLLSPVDIERAITSTAGYYHAIPEAIRPQRLPGQSQMEAAIAYADKKFNRPPANNSKPEPPKEAKPKSQSLKIPFSAIQRLKKENRAERIRRDLQAETQSTSDIDQSASPQIDTPQPDQIEAFAPEVHSASMNIPAFNQADFPITAPLSLEKPILGQIEPDNHLDFAIERFARFQNPQNFGLTHQEFLQRINSHLSTISVDETAEITNLRHNNPELIRFVHQIVNQVVETLKAEKAAQDSLRIKQTILQPLTRTALEQSAHLIGVSTDSPQFAAIMVGSFRAIDRCTQDLILRLNPSQQQTLAMRIANTALRRYHQSKTAESRLTSMTTTLQAALAEFQPELAHYQLSEAEINAAAQASLNRLTPDFLRSISDEQVASLPQQIAANTVQSAIAKTIADQQKAAEEKRIAAEQKAIQHRYARPRIQSALNSLHPLKSNKNLIQQFTGFVSKMISRN